MIKCLRLLLVLALLPLAQTQSSLGPLKVKTDQGRSAYVGFVSQGRAVTIFLSADAAAPERTEPLPLTFIVDGRRIELEPARRSKETGDAKRDVLQRWTAPLPADNACDVGSGSEIVLEVGELTFSFGPHLDKVKRFAGRLCDDYHD